MSFSDSDVTAAETYALWGERIRCLFAAPPSFIETTVATSPFERHTCSFPSTSLPFTDTTHNNHDTNYKMGLDSTSDAPSQTGRFYDEALYPFCFYTRLLESTARHPPLRDDHTPAAMPAVEAMESSAPSSSLHAQRLRIDDDDLASRLASKLRARNREQVAQLQRQNTVSSTLVSAFCDPQVEAQQARLHAELTDFLLTVRERNRASVALRQQLQRSRLVRERIHDSAAAMSFSPRSASQPDND